MKFFYFLLLSLFISTTILSQYISGVVTDEEGTGLLGATILVKGTTIGASTDFDGKFNLE